MLNMQPSTLRSLLEQLDQASQDHLEWHANLLRAIVCELPCDPDDLAPDAHRLCRFGRWYYDRVPIEVRHEPTFTAIGFEHQRVHQVATAILEQVSAGRSVARDAFDELMACSLRLRRELDLVRRELQVTLRSRDALTGAYERDQVLPELRRWVAPVNRDAGPCCIVLMDLDRLKEVNSTHGHLVGDELLAEVVRSLCEHLRPGDKVFRYGGDEFLISLPGADLTMGQAVVARLRENLARCQLLLPGAAVPFQPTASFGIAMLDAHVRLEDSIDHAAQALLLAKTAGGNRAISWDPSVTTGRYWQRLEMDVKR